MSKYKHLELKAKEAVNFAKKNGCLMLTCIDGFITDDEALKLRDLLWYAKSKKVAVMFTV